MPNPAKIIDELLHDYRSTPHPATGLTPGDMMLRVGYQTKFPQQTNPTENQIQEAKIRDSHRKEVASAKIDASCWRKYPKIIQGDKVLVKRSSKTNKFVSQFDPTPHMVTDVQGSRYELVADNDLNNAHSIFRHISDIKLYKPYQHPQRYQPPQSRHKYSSLNNTPANPACHTLPHLVRIIPLTTKLQLSPYQDHQILTHNKRERERWI